MASPGWLLARGFGVGLLVAAPVGPMALLTIRRTLDRGWTSGLASGLGIATADAIYSAIAAFGISIVSAALLGHAGLVQVAGGALIALLGIRTALSPAADTPAAAGITRRTLAADYVSCLGLTLANPPTIISFAAILAGIGVGTTAGGWPAAAVVAGVAAGSAAWWLVLVTVVDRARAGLSARVRLVLTRAAGAALGLLGIGVLLSAALHR